MNSPRPDKTGKSRRFLQPIKRKYGKGVPWSSYDLAAGSAAATAAIRPRR